MTWVPYASLMTVGMAVLTILSMKRQDSVDRIIIGAFKGIIGLCVLLYFAATSLLIGTPGVQGGISVMVGAICVLGAYTGLMAWASSIHFDWIKHVQTKLDARSAASQSSAEKHSTG